MKKCKIKKGDEVIVITGENKGKKGQVQKVLKDIDRLIIAGVNVAKRHVKPGRGQAGGIVEKELPIHISNVALVDPKEGKATRVGYKFLENGDKVRFAKRSGEQIG